MIAHRGEEKRKENVMKEKGNGFYMTEEKASLKLQITVQYNTKHDSTI